MNASTQAVSCRDLPFGVYLDAAFFEKAGEPSGKRRRIAGVASSEEQDQEFEVILQEGIDWSYFLERGYFNDNHDKSIDGIIGYPDFVERFRRGQKLPNGTTASVACTWAEGYLLDNEPRADSVWRKGLALQGTPRGLGLSVEGKSRARSLDGRTVVKSVVRHCAVTHQPVNRDAQATLFLKSLAAASQASQHDLERAWDAFEKALAEPTEEGPPTKLITKARAVDLVVERYPGLLREKARRFVDLVASRRLRG